MCNLLGFPNQFLIFFKFFGRNYFDVSISMLLTPCVVSGWPPPLDWWSSVEAVGSPLSILSIIRWCPPSPPLPLPESRGSRMQYLTQPQVVRDSTSPSHSWPLSVFVYECLCLCVPVSMRVIVMCVFVYVCLCPCVSLSCVSLSMCVCVQCPCVSLSCVSLSMCVCVHVCHCHASAPAVIILLLCQDSDYFLFSAFLSQHVRFFTPGMWIRLNFCESGSSGVFFYCGFGFEFSCFLMRIRIQLKQITVVKKSCPELKRTTKIVQK